MNIDGLMPPYCAQLVGMDRCKHGADPGGVPLIDMIIEFIHDRS